MNGPCFPAIRPYRRTNEILNESNEIAGLQKRLEMSGREVLLLQHELDNKISNMSDRTLEMGQVHLGVTGKQQVSVSEFQMRKNTSSRRSR